MVITCLMEMIVGNPDVLYHHTTTLPARQQWEEGEEDLVSTDLALSGGLDPLNRSSSLNLEDTQRFLAGNYRVILQLVAVLANGKVAKRLTDRACDVCDQMQNLRSAINDYRLNTSSLEPKSPKYHRLLEVGCNYLVRYFYLVCFADYLLEVWASFVPDATAAIRPATSFSAWLTGRAYVCVCVCVCVCV